MTAWLAELKNKEVRKNNGHNDLKEEDNTASLELNAKIWSWRC